MSKVTNLCRICLATNCKMYQITKSSLLEVFKTLIDENIISLVCWECIGQLRSAARLQQKANMAQEILTHLHLDNDEICTETLESERLKHKLCSNLRITIKNLISISPGITEISEIKNEDIYSDENYGGDFTMVTPSMDLNPVEITVKVDPMEEYDAPCNSDVDTDELPLKTIVTRNRKKKVKLEKKSKIKWIDPKERCKEIIGKSQKTKELDKVLETGFDITRLTYEQQLEEVQKRKEHKKYLRLAHKCDICFLAFADEAKYNNHVIRHKEECGKHECRVCKLRYKSAKSLHKHMYSWHFFNYICRTCKMFTKNRSVASRHLEWHSGKIFQCAQCQMQFTHLSTYLSHKRLKHVSEFACELCGYTFLSQKGIYTHKHRMHIEDVNNPTSLEGPNCVECDVKFVSQEAYDRHLALSAKHSSDDTMKSKSDSLKKATKVKRKMEDRKEFINRPITCEICGEVVAGMQCYAWHFRKRHPGARRERHPPRRAATHVCDKCGKTFTNTTFYRDHVRSHTEENCFECGVCKKRFQARHYLRIHAKVHDARSGQFACADCGGDFSSKSNLYRHRLIHEGQRLYKCKHCAKRFNSSDGLKSHTDHIHLKKPWPTRVRSARRTNED